MPFIFALYVCDATQLAATEATLHCPASSSAAMASSSARMAEAETSQQESYGRRGSGTT
jgi:hypothetical protein